MPRPADHDGGGSLYGEVEVCALWCFGITFHNEGYDITSGIGFGFGVGATVGYNNVRTSQQEGEAYEVCGKAGVGACTSWGKTKSGGTWHGGGLSVGLGSKIKLGGFSPLDSGSVTWNETYPYLDSPGCNAVVQVSC